jgi:hypothetical protein
MLTLEMLYSEAELKKQHFRKQAAQGAVGSLTERWLLKFIEYTF